MNDEHESEIPNDKARLATLAQLKAGVISAYLNPIPHDDTIRSWLDRAKVPRLKSNPHAVRGGGLVYYSVSAVETLLKRMLPGNLDPVPVQKTFPVKKWKECAEKLAFELEAKQDPGESSKALSLFRSMTTDP